MRLKQTVSQNSTRITLVLGYSIVFIVLWIMLSGCQSRMQVRDTTDVTAELTVRRDENQNISMIIIHSGAISEVEEAGERASDAIVLAAAFKRFIKENAHIYGVDKMADLPDFELRKGLGPPTIRDELNAESQTISKDDADFDENEQIRDYTAPMLTTLDFSQEHRGVRLLKGNLRASYINGKLFSIKGRIFPLHKWAEQVDKQLDTSRMQFKEITKSQCSEYDESLQTGKLSKSLYYMPTSERVVHLVICDRELLIFDPVKGEVLGKTVPFLPERWSKAKVSVWGTGDGDLLSTPRPWVPVIDVTPPNDDTRLYTQVRADRRTSNTPGKCDWRASYGIQSGGDHPYPKAKLRDSDWIERGYDCNDFSSHPFRRITPNRLWAQGAYELMQRAAWHAKWSPMMRQLTWLSNINAPVHNNSAPLVKIYRTHGDEGECGAFPGNGSTGSYFWIEDRICLNPSEGAIVHRSPLHEYGHYMNDVLGWNHGLPDNIFDGWKCGALSAHEGSADAHVINYLHRRFYPNLPVRGLSDAQISDLFLEGPGPGMERDNGRGILFDLLVGLGLERANFPVNTQSEDDLVSAANVCTGDDWPGAWWHYRDGLAIPQVLWKFLNNRVCVFDLAGNCLPERIKQTALHPENIDWEVEVVGREAFTYAITQGGHDSPWDYLQDMAVWICATRYVHFPVTDDFNRARTAFTQNGVSLSCWH